MGAMSRITDDVMSRSSPGGGTIPVGRHTTTVFTCVRQKVSPGSEASPRGGHVHPIFARGRS